VSGGLNPSLATGLIILKYCDIVVAYLQLLPGSLNFNEVFKVVYNLYNFQS